MYTAGFYLGLAVIVLFPAIMLFYLSFAKRQDHVPFHYRNCFPYEAFVDREKRQDILARVLQALALLAGLLPAVFALVAFKDADLSFTGYLYGFLAISIVSAAAFLLLTILPLSHPRSHLLIFFVFMATVIIKKGMAGLSLLQMAEFTSMTIAKVVGIIVLCLIVSEAAVVANPKLKNWDRLETVTNEKGEQVVRRPKWFVLAYSEWFVFFVGILADLITLIAIYVAREPMIKP